MKRIAFVVVGLVALSGVVYVGDRLNAQGTGTPAAPAAPPRPQTRVAVVNMKYVLTYYTKQQKFMDEIKGAKTALDAKAKEMNDRIEELSKNAAKAGATQADKDNAVASITKMKREMEDASMKVQQEMVQKGESHIRGLFAEILDAARRFAQGQGYDMVLSYSDGITEQELLNPQAMGAKLQMVPLMPLYTAPGMDISRELVMSLNDAHARSTPAPAPGTPAPGTPAPGTPAPGGAAPK